MNAMREAERNPIIVSLFAIGGVAAVVLVKLTLVWWVVLRDKRRTTSNRPKLTGVFMLAAGISGFIGAFFNSLALKSILGV